MAKENIISKLVYKITEKIFAVSEDGSRHINNPRNFLIIRQHNQLGDLLAGVSLFRAIKETFPESRITLVVSPENYFGITKNKFIDEYFVFDKKKIFNPVYFDRAAKLLSRNYDVVIVPVTVSVSFTSNLLARLANAKTRIGPNSLDGNLNKSKFLFDRRVDLDWRQHPDSNVAERILDIVKPFGISTNNYRSEISFDNDDLMTAENFLRQLSYEPAKLLVGIHPGAGKIPNRWSLIKFVSLIKKLGDNFPSVFYLTGSSADAEEINYLTQNISFKIGTFLNRTIPQVAALISKSNLFITNDTGIMHVAGATDTSQISIFGPTNPYNWAPIGSNKIFIRKSELIDEITVDEVYELCIKLISEKVGNTGNVI